MHCARDTASCRNKNSTSVINCIIVAFQLVTIRVFRITVLHGLDCGGIDGTSNQSRSRDRASTARWLLHQKLALKMLSYNKELADVNEVLRWLGEENQTRSNEIKALESDHENPSD